MNFREPSKAWEWKSEYALSIVGYNWSLSDWMLNLPDNLQDTKNNLSENREREGVLGKYDKDLPALEI